MCGPRMEGVTGLRVQVAARHVDVSEGIRELIQERADHLLRIFGGVSTIHVTLSAEKERRIVEFVANVSHGAPAVGKAEADDLAVAIHEAAEKVGTQLRRHKDRIRGHRDRDIEPERRPAEAEENGEPETDEASEGDDVG